MAGWSAAEIDAIVRDYLEMLEAERRGVPYKKSEHRRRLAPKLNNRSDPAIERKHMNISAVLVEAGVPPLTGYVPLYNYQQALVPAVEAALERAGSLLEAVAEDLERAPATPKVDDILAAEVPPPKEGRGAATDRRLGSPLDRKPRLGVNYIELEAANQKLGAAGEVFVLRYERERLLHAGCDKLAEDVRRVSIESDALGFDVLSYNPDTSERFIEVKTTAYMAETPFYVTRNELWVSRQEAKRYHLYRVFDFHRQARFYRRAGRLDDKYFLLDPKVYEARIA